MFQIPSLKDLVERSRAAFRAHLPGSDAWLWPNNVNPTAKVIGGMSHEVFAFADYIQRQKFALTADGENLDLHGAEYGLARRPAAPATGKVTITATEAASSVDGALFRRADGIEYRATSAGNIAQAGTFDVDVVATTDGKTTIAIASEPLEIVSGVTGDATAAVHSAGIVGGVDVEADGSFFSPEPGTFRERILFRKRNPPHGGSAADYVMWAKQLSGVTRVFVERLWSGTGTVRVFPLMDDLYANGIPPGGEISRVQDYLEALRPAGAILNVAAPTPVTVNVTIADLTPDTTAVREAVSEELRATFRRLSRVAGIDIELDAMPYLAFPTSFSQSWLWQAVANATGERRHTITSPNSDVALTPGQMAVLGTVTFA